MMMGERHQCLGGDRPQRRRPGWRTLLPLFHTAGINLHTLPLFLMGGVSHILPKFDLDGLLDLMAAGKVSVFFGGARDLSAAVAQPALPAIWI